MDLYPIMYITGQHSSSNSFTWEVSRRDLQCSILAASFSDITKAGLRLLTPKGCKPSRIHFLMITFNLGLLTDISAFVLFNSGFLASLSFAFHILGSSNLSRLVESNIRRTSGTTTKKKIQHFLLETIRQKFMVPLN